MCRPEGSFIRANDDLSTLSEQGVRLDFRRSSGSRIDMWVYVDEHTTIKDVESSWWLISEWRNRLMAYQGPWLLGGDSHFYEFVWHQHKSGHSYARIANEINARIADLLVENSELQKEYEAAAPSFETWEDYWSWEFAILKQRRYNFMGWQYALSLMRLSGIKAEDEQLEWANYALESIGRGEQPFPPDTPVTKEMVRARLRWWAGKRSLWKDRANDTVRSWFQEITKSEPGPPRGHG